MALGQIGTCVPFWPMCTLLYTSWVWGKDVSYTIVRMYIWENLSGSLWNGFLGSLSFFNLCLNNEHLVQTFVSPKHIYVHFSQRIIYIGVELNNVNLHACIVFVPQ